MKKTEFSDLKLFADHIINQLKQDSLLEFSISQRSSLIDALAHELNVGLLTDEDLHDEITETLNDNQEKLDDEDVTQNEAYIHTKKELIKSFKGEMLSGFYLSETLFKLAERIKMFLTESALVEEVYGTDEELISNIVKKFKSYNPPRTL